MVSIAILAVIIVIFFVNKQRNDQPQKFPREQATMVSLPVLSVAKETALQVQAQNIVTNGKETDCDTITDFRYQFACHEFFRVQKGSLVQPSSQR